MNIKSLLLRSAAVILTVTGAHAADIVIAEPEPVEYVRVCDAYGAGYFYIPGTQTCMRISGYMRTTLGGGDDVYALRRDKVRKDTYDWSSRATVRFHTASETDLGTLRTLIELRSEWANGGDTTSGSLRKGYIELGGLRAGLDDSIFAHWTGYYGNVVNDDVMSPLGKRTHVISYTYNAGNGFSAIIGVEQGGNSVDKYGYRSPVWDPDTGEVSFRHEQIGGVIDDYTPNVVGGLKFAQGWGGVALVAAYDARIEEWAAKARIDYNVTEQFSLWAMAGYKSGDDYYGATEASWTKRRNGTTVDHYGYHLARQSMYGDWGGAWVAWTGGTYKFTPKTSFNFQTAYDDSRTFTAAVNLSHELVPGLTITPELGYVKWDNNWKARNADATEILNDTMKGKNAVQGVIQLQRSF
ncbi:MAG: Porin [Candidatus Tokpelaia hoelldobleri]|uniref:Porin n=1 Tax=Candidatus Tokpelaia hoelldobleri TaxID=1902579 RepID=A0A1U9JVT5_9HYPH|nr:MAG: Porin [Candidatus Tokpelaia hoelldoblerii]